MKIGIIGVGTIAAFHIEAYQKNPNVEVYAFCDINEKRLKAMGEKYGVTRLYTDKDEMLKLEELDAVSVCTWNSAHAPCSIAALKAGKHVLCEKPMASNAREVRAMIEASRRNGVALMEAVKTTLTPNFMALREALPKAGTLRRYFSAFCQYSSRYDKFKEGVVLNAFRPELSNGAMMDIGVYTVYPMVALFGRPLEVEAQGIVLSSGADGQGAVNFRYEGMNATVLYSKIANSSLPTEIQGEEGNLLLDAIHTIRDVAYLPRPAAASGRGDAPVRHSVGLPLEKDTYYYEVAEFIDLIEQGRIESAVNSHENSLVTMEIIDQVRRQLGVSYPADRLP